MKVKEMIAMLSTYNGDMDLLITDGYDCRYYEGNYSVVEFEGAVEIRRAGGYLSSEFENIVEI